MFIEDLSFDECFELSLFKSKSETALDDTILDPEFLVDLKIQRENTSIDDYILNSPQTSVTVTNIPEPSELLETTFHDLNSSVFPSVSEVSSQLSSPPSTPPLHPSRTNPVVNPPQVMAAWYAPLVLPQQLNDMSADYQSKIPIFNAT